MPEERFAFSWAQSVCGHRFNEMDYAGDYGTYSSISKFDSNLFDIVKSLPAEAMERIIKQANLKKLLTALLLVEATSLHAQQQKLLLKIQERKSTHSLSMVDRVLEKLTCRFLLCRK